MHGERVYVGLWRERNFVSKARSQPVQSAMSSAFRGTDLFGSRSAQPHRMDERNPVGRGVALRARSIWPTGPRTPSNIRAGNPAAVGPAGFGPIDPAWLPRRALAGTCRTRAVGTDRRSRCSPEDSESGVHAEPVPLDQRVPVNRWSEASRFELVNHDVGRVESFSSSSRLSLDFTSRFGWRREPHATQQLATVLIEPEEQRLSVVWQSTLRVIAPRVDYLDGNCE